MRTDLRLGRWQDVLADVGEVDAIVCDPPYSARVHDSHNSGVDMARNGSWPRKSGKPDPRRPRSPLRYEHWTAADVDALVESWAPRNLGWFVCLSDSDLCPAWRTAFERHGLLAFHPLPILMRGMAVRRSGDGPSSWAVYANVARPRREPFSKWGTLPGAYHGPPEPEPVIAGQKPVWLMRALCRDYSRPGDLVADPCAGAATTLLAAAIEGRRSVGAECDPKTFGQARDRLAGGYTADLFAASTGA